MERDQLKAWLDEGLSLIEIGERAGRHPATVGYWVTKLGLTANGKRRYAPRGALDRERLEALVNDRATLAEIAGAVDRSVSTVRYWLKKYGLAVRGAHRHRALADAAVAAGRRRFISVCRHHGECEFLVFASGRYRCARCNSEAVARRRRRVKATLVAEAGGRCALCGFDRHPSALHFHHLDPGEKDFAVSNRGATVALALSRAEAGKCVLLCANCHALVEAGVAGLSEGLAVS